MPEIITTCTQCQRQLRVPEELQGRMVKCPACQFTFTIARTQSPQPAPESVAPGAAAGQLPEPGRGIPLPARPQETNEEAEERVRAAVQAPAIALAVVGVLGFLVCGFGLVNVTVNEDMVRAQAQQIFQAMMAGENAQPPLDAVVAGMRFTYAGLAVLSILVVMGAVQMMRLRTYWLAVLAAVLAMLNITCGCCVVGLPVGIWALIVLFRPGTSSVFQ